MNARGKRLDFGKIFCETVEDVHANLLFVRYKSFAANTAPYASAALHGFSLIVFQFALISEICGRWF